MRTSNIQLRLPDDIKDAAMRQAAESGVSLNLFIATAVAVRVGAQPEISRALAARTARTTPTRAKTLLGRLGKSTPVHPDDRLDAPDD